MSTSAPVTGWSSTVTLPSGYLYTYTVTPGAGGTTILQWSSDGTTWHNFSNNGFSRTTRGAVPAAAAYIRGTSTGAAGTFDTALAGSLQFPSVYGPLSTTDLLALSDAGSLQPNTIYQTSDGPVCLARSSTLLQPFGMWFSDGRTWDVGTAATATDLSYCYVPALGHNGQIHIYHQWIMDKDFAVTKRLRIYLDGTLGGGVTGATQVYTRNYNDTTNVGINTFTKISNLNSQNSQEFLTVGDGTSFNQTTSAFLTGAVPMSSSKLLRTMGENAKSGSDVPILTLDRSGTTALASVASTTPLATGMYIGVTGAAVGGYNLDPVPITVTSSTTFTYPLVSDPGSAAGGSPAYQKYCYVRLQNWSVFVHQFPSF